MQADPNAVIWLVVIHPSKHVLLMDEVDGMAGNEDRGGMQVWGENMIFTCFVSFCVCAFSLYLVFVCAFVFRFVLI